MKKIYLSLSILLFNICISYAQWTNNGSNTIYSGSGNIGIGNAAPSEKLEVTGNLKLTYGNFIKMSNNTNHVLLHTQRSDSTIPAILGANGWGAFTINNSLGIGYDLLSYPIGNANLLVRDYIGIGTIYPTEKLEVIGNIKLGANNAGSYIYSVANASLPLLRTTRTDLSMIGLLKGNGWGDFTVSNSFGVGYDLEGSNRGEGNLFVKGNIAIGTTDAQGYRLAINGNAIAESITVKVHTNWPDYVFKNDYQLPSLLNVKAFIEKNHHLPDMPSEEQVNKEGLNLGEINKVLTKKVEELTLYLIEQNKNQIDQLKLINDLQSRMKQLEDKTK